MQLYAFISLKLCFINH